MLHPSIYNTSEICYAFGVRHIVVSPGSRNAPLTISFARNEKIKKWIIPDERAAGFIALGIAQKRKEPVALCCTSGSAVLNYYPAITEAFYREIPLIVLSADRPLELIDQRDGQTIRQFEVLDKHVKISLQLPIIRSEEDEQTYNSELKNALTIAQSLPEGPVHLNIPFEEPFYPDNKQELRFTSQKTAIRKQTTDCNTELAIDLADKKVLVLIGQKEYDEKLSASLSKTESTVPIIKSPLNNLEIEGISHVDFFLADQPELQPDILLTTGLSVLSKKLKNYLRKHKPKAHYHFDPAEVKVDTYQSNPILIKADLLDFLKVVNTQDADANYLKSWKKLSLKTAEAVNNYSGVYSEMKIARIILNSIPHDSEVHLANSMPVRWADLFGINNNVETFSNRGTSGIDGCTSTAIGTSLVSTKLNILLTGDIAFFYDRNAFFHNISVPNLRIVLLNNSGGGIFRLIEGPSSQPELEDYFETRHKRTAEYICRENEFDYFTVTSEMELNDCLNEFYKSSENIKVLEIFTDPKINQNEFKQLKAFIHERIN